MSTSTTYLTGLASGWDWSDTVDQLTELERTPQTRMSTEQSKLSARNLAYTSIKTQLNALKACVDKFKDGSLFSSRTSSVSNSTIASAAVEADAPLGSYTFNITQRATTAVQKGAANAGAALSATDNVSGVVLSSAAFSSAITAGTFTVNGKTVTVATTDTLQEVFDKIDTATSGTVTASYSSSSDKITFSSSSEIVLGSATDTSNFLQATKLVNNGTGTVTSASSLGGIKLSSTLSDANFSTTISDGGSGAGEFKINGVSIAFSTTSDSAQNVIKRINDSAAGVTASYDSVNDRFILTNKTTGDVGITMEDVTGNFVAATQLSGGTLERGKNLLYTVNAGGQLTSQSNTITETSSGITGLSVTALKEGEVTVEVNSNTSSIKAAITDLIEKYNTTQTLIGGKTASTTDDDGTVTAGTLADEQEVSKISSQLRSVVYSSVSGLSGVIKQLEQLGYVTNGTDDSLSLNDSTKLDDALADNLSDVKALFSDTTNGIATRLSTYLEQVTDDGGLIDVRQDTLTKQMAGLDEQIAAQEVLVQAYHDRLVASFTAMETAQSNINQQLQYLTRTFS
ncbi:MAG: flagellar filament capping protein FliD [Verrucomicrobia bacterium]|nr:flagellar filament capping protein FliD [Verrucomicrobiota bacterium]